jgi:uncharacterized protein (DUF427 family)
MRVGEILKRAAHAVGLHRISTRACARRVRVVHAGGLLAESGRAVEMRETGLPTRYYLPRADVRMDLLRPSATRSHCPFKGDAIYFSAAGVEDAFWAYDAPTSEAAAPIAGMLAPRPGRVDVVVDDQRVAR